MPFFIFANKNLAVGTVDTVFMKESDWPILKTTSIW